MALTMKIRFVDQLANGVLRFRRRFPQEIAKALGKPTLQVHMRNRECFAFQSEYQAVCQEFNRIVGETRAKLEGRDTRSPITRWHEALMIAEGLAAERNELGAREGFLSQETPLAETHNPTLQDAVEKYREVKRLAKDESVRLNRTAARLEEALGSLREIRIEILHREHGHRFLEHLMSKTTSTGKLMARGSVEKEINIARAVVNKGVLEMDLKNVSNPFEKLELPKAMTAAVDAKLPLSDDQTAAVQTRLDAGTNEDLKLAWGLLKGTGARLGEIAGLTMADIDLTAQTPCIHIRPNSIRGLKTTSSVRSVSLVGEAFEVAPRLSECASGYAAFPRYAKTRGADSMSAALMKHLRKETTDKRYSVHGLRHALQDKLRLRGAPSEVYKDILGHSATGIAESTYGSAQARLEVQAKWLERALALR